MSRHKNSVTTRYFTTNEVGSMFGVSNTTVVNWVKSGRLAAHLTPGGHRRIAQTEVVTFARANKYPVPPDVTPAPTTLAKRVLVVDDEVDFSDMVREYLTNRCRLNVDVANFGFLAGQAVERFDPHLILLDLAMPDLDGFQVHQLLRSDPKTAHIPIVACTGLHEVEVEDRIRAAGFDGFIEKPLKLDELLELIRDLLNL